MATFCEHRKRTSPHEVIRYGLRNKSPEFFGMIEHHEMTEFVHDNVILERFGQCQDPIVKIKIPLL